MEIGFSSNKHGSEAILKMLRVRRSLHQLVSCGNIWLTKGWTMLRLFSLPARLLRADDVCTELGGIPIRAIKVVHGGDGHAGLNIRRPRKFSCGGSDCQAASIALLPELLQV